MLKMMAEGKKHGRPVTLVVMGLSHRNLDLLREKRPIIFDGEEINVPGFEFIIFSEVDEETMQEKVKDLIGPNTEVRISPRFKKGK